MINPYFYYIGGKLRLFDQLQDNFPKQFTTYVDPFAGGGVMFLNLMETKRCFVNDLNEKLINTFRTVRNLPESVYKGLMKIVWEYRELETLEQKKEYFYDVKNKYNNINQNKTDDLIDNARYFIFLCNTCFNGCYRENNKGMFNQCFGNRKKFYIPDYEDFCKLSLNKYAVYLFSKDYRDFINQMIDICSYPAETLVYMDPPYRKNGNKYSSKYCCKEFGNEENLILFDYFKKLDDAGFNVMMTQQFDEDGFLRDLYKNFDIKTVNNRCLISPNAADRDVTKELIIKNY